MEEILGNQFLLVFVILTYKLRLNYRFRTAPKPAPKTAPKPSKKQQEPATKEGALPYFTIKPRSQETIEGMQIRLSCGANGSPDPEFTWFKNGSLLQSDARMEIKNTVGMSSLIIKESEIGDAGVYKAIAKNRAGEVEAEAEVVVEGIVVFNFL